MLNTLLFYLFWAREREKHSLDTSTLKALNNIKKGQNRTSKNERQNTVWYNVTDEDDDNSNIDWFKCAFRTVRAPLAAFDLKIKAKSDMASDKIRWALCRAVTDVLLMCTCLVKFVTYTSLFHRGSRVMRSPIDKCIVLIAFWLCDFPSSFFSSLLVGAVCARLKKNNDHVSLSLQ